MFRPIGLYESVWRKKSTWRQKSGRAINIACPTQKKWAGDYRAQCSYSEVQKANVHFVVTNKNSPAQTYRYKSVEN